METRMSENSLIANHRVDKVSQKKKILQVYKKGYKIGATTVSDLTGIPLGTVTARINELRYEDGLIIKVGDDHRNRSIYKLRTDEPKDSRELSKYEKLLKDLTDLKAKLERLDTLPKGTVLGLIDNLINNPK